MSGHDIGSVDLDLALQGHGGATLDDPLAESLDHLLSVAAMDAEFLTDLQGGQVQAHQVEADDPGPKRLVMASEDGVGEVIEAFATATTEVALAMRLCLILAILDDGLGRTMGTRNTVRPAEVSNGLIAPGVVDEVTKIDHGWA